MLRIRTNLKSLANLNKVKENIFTLKSFIAILHSIWFPARTYGCFLGNTFNAIRLGPLDYWRREKRIQRMKPFLTSWPFWFFYVEKSSQPLLFLFLTLPFFFFPVFFGFLYFLPSIEEAFFSLPPSFSRLLLLKHVFSLSFFLSFFLPFASLFLLTVVGFDWEKKRMEFL